MQITRNSTGMLAGLTVTGDRDAHDYCVVVIKGSFIAASDGVMRLAREQVPFVYADEHNGDPEITSIRHECDFALFKPFTDVVVVGKAIAPGGRAREELVVRLEVAGRVKEAVVVGERRWRRAGGSIAATPAVPFVEMPLLFERAFGGEDSSLGPGKAAAEVRNLVGVGFHPHRPADEIHDTPLPNIEDPRQRIVRPRDRPAPIGFGFVGRAWSPRSSFAGTYDQSWLDEVCPFLPDDFDHRYHQGAPVDQQFPQFRGGEIIRCTHMAAQPVVQYTVPALDIPVRFCFRDRDVKVLSVLDTVVLEPHLNRATLCWRARVMLGKCLDDLREIHVGAGSAQFSDERGHLRGKPVFAGIDATLRWLAGHRGGTR